MAVAGLFLGWRHAGGAFHVLCNRWVLWYLDAAYREKERKDTVPFGPFLGGSVVIAALYGQQLISPYLAITGVGVS